MVGGRGGLLGELLPLNDHLDIVFLQPALIIVAPPHGPLVFASEPEMFAGSAGRRALVALFSSQSACVATYEIRVSRGEREHEATVRKVTRIKVKPNKPVRDRLCICIFPFGVEFGFAAGLDFC